MEAVEIGVEPENSVDATDGGSGEGLPERINVLIDWRTSGGDLGDATVDGD